MMKCSVCGEAPASDKFGADDLCWDCLMRPMKLSAIATKVKHDLVNHPPHYTDHPSGVECIQIAEHMGFCLGNAVKYIWRAGLKGAAVTDLEKARWYIDREIARRKASKDAKDS